MESTKKNTEEEIREKIKEIDIYIRNYTNSKNNIENSSSTFLKEEIPPQAFSAINTIIEMINNQSKINNKNIVKFSPNEIAKKDEVSILNTISQINNKKQNEELLSKLNAISQETYEISLKLKKIYEKKLENMKKNASASASASSKQKTA